MESPPRASAWRGKRGGALLGRHTGPAPRAELTEKRFEPFFTTKPPGQGTGLGLSLSHEIVVRGRQGSFRMESTPAEFAECIVTLPRGARVAQR